MKKFRIIELPKGGYEVIEIYGFLWRNWHIGYLRRAPFNSIQEAENAIKIYNTPRKIVKEITF